LTAHTPPDRRVALPRILAFSLPSLPLAALGLPLVVQLPQHYSSYVGVSLAVVGTLFMVARLADIIVDIGIGLAMDQTRTRIGRFSPWLLACSPVIAIAAWFLFMAQPGSGALYLGVALFVTYVGFSMGSLSQMSLGATLSDDYHERSRVFAFWQVFNVIGMLLALMIPVITHALGMAPEYGVQGMGLFIVILIPITALIAARFAGEANPKAQARKTSVADIGALLQSRACRKLLGADLVLSFSAGVTGGLFLFYFAAVKDLGGLSPALLLIYFVTGLAGAPIWVWIAKRWGKDKSLMAACAFGLLTQPAIILFPPGNFLVASLGMGIAGLSYTAGAYLLRAMMADIGDEDLLRTGQDRTGLLYALVTLTGKAGYALAVGVTYIGLDLVGFVPRLGPDNSADALNGLTALFIGLPVLATIIGASFLIRYPIDAARTAQLQAEIEVKRAAG
jgi:glycoside/pentoside/hexuronide:cation symporter, GPH family